VPTVPFRAISEVAHGCAAEGASIFPSPMSILIGRRGVTSGRDISLVTRLLSRCAG
jgi:hypothetical protein